MDPRSEVLLRQPELFTGSVLLAGLPADDLMSALPDATGWSWHAGECRYLQQRFGSRSTFGIYPDEKEVEAAVLFLPKSRELSEYLINVLASRLRGGRLYLVGEKRGGIERAAQLLRSLGEPQKLDSARHCQLWQVRIDGPVATPELQDLAQRFTLDVNGGDLNVISLPGVFAHGRLDRGSALLLEHLDNLPAGHLLDFGCGAGVLGACLKRRYPDNEISLMDVDAFAVEASRLTLKANGLDANVFAGDGIASAPIDLAGIISNPPFHHGVHTHYQASEDLLRQACLHLRPLGELRIVANSFLRYPPLIEQHIGTCETVAERDGFRIYRASRR
jgi:16S rRNA (guanine1207-N2)-methyltransferase